MNSQPHSADPLHATRRQFFGRGALGLGTAALAQLLTTSGHAAAPTAGPGAAPTLPLGLPGLPHHAAKAKRIIYLFQSGGPSQMDLFDPKPQLKDRFDQDLPDSVRKGQRLTTMTSGQARFPVAPSIFKFAQHGQSGAWISELLPHTAKIADDLCFIKSMWTEPINHDPAITFFQTGFQLAGRPSIGAWASYGLGSENRDLPDFTVLVSRGSGRPSCQPLYDRLWGAGFLPGKHQGVRFLSTNDPVLHLSNPAGIDGALRRETLDDMAALNRLKLQDFGDPEIAVRIAQYELAYRMQTSVPELTDLSGESKAVLDSYGPEVLKRGTFASNCLLARRLAERDVRFVQLFHMGWDQHAALPKQLAGQCRDTDQPAAALVADLKRLGLLDDTLVVWGGEFGRTIYSQGKLTATDYGRDHHPSCFTMWLAGAGVKPGFTLGATDDYCVNITADPVHVHDLNATILHLLGVDHTKLTFKFQGRYFRLTDVHGHVVKKILA